MARREQILDAAIDVVAMSGIGAMTHRAVDAAAGLPIGSTSNLFRTKEALLIGVVDRFVAREMHSWRDVAEQHSPTTPRTLAKVLAALAVAQTTSNRTLTLARHSVLLEAAHQPRVRAALASGGGQIMRPVEGWFKAAGSRRPAQDAAVVANYIAGLVMHELANPADQFDPGPALRSLVMRLLAPNER